MNDHKQELVKTDRKYPFFKKIVPISSSPLPFTELVFIFVSISEQRNKLLTVTSETWKYFIHSNRHWTLKAFLLVIRDEYSKIKTI